MKNFQICKYDWDDDTNDNGLFFIEKSVNLGDWKSNDLLEKAEAFADKCGF